MYRKKRLRIRQPSRVSREPCPAKSVGWIALTYSASTGSARSIREERLSWVFAICLADFLSSLSGVWPFPRNCTERPSKYAPLSMARDWW